MKRYLISNPSRFSGTIELMFNATDQLFRIDLAESEISEDVIRHLLKVVPTSIDQLMTGNNFGPGTIVVAAEFEVTFDMYYNSYPFKRNRHRVIAEWEKLNKSDMVIAYMSLIGYKKYCSKNSSWYNPMLPDRYLKERHFETDWNKAQKPGA